MSYLLTIEAPDASGKTTQVNLLKARLEKDGLNVRLVRFPNYGSDACKPAELYLGGALGKNPSDTNAYAASVLFAVDRYFSYRLDWEELYRDENSVILLDRYTTSNAIHQLSKISDEKEREAFLDWLYDLEFAKMGLPIPDDTVFLDVDPDVSLRLLREREKNDPSHRSDIHEASGDYLRSCYEASIFASEKKGWKRLVCTRDGKMRSIDEIHEELYGYVKGRIQEKRQSTKGI